jgi:hypothetical protein
MGLGLLIAMSAFYSRKEGLSASLAHSLDLVS